MSVDVCYLLDFVFFFKQKTAYEMRISDWSSNVCSSDLPGVTSSIHSFVDLNAIALKIGISDSPGSMPRPVGMRRRTEESCVGKECVSTCRSRSSPYH